MRSSEGNDRSTIDGVTARSGSQRARRQRFTWLSSIGVCALIGWAAQGPATAQWRQWGGPTRDFKSAETGLAETWSPAGPPLLWQVEHAGNYASLLVDGDLLFSMFKAGDDTEVVRALSTADGSTRWQLRYQIPTPPDAVMRNFGLGPNATPAIVGDRLVTIGFLGHLWCLRKTDGAVLWQRDLVADFGAKIHMFGYSISPLARGDNVIVAVGGEEHGVVAFDSRSGEVAWASPPIDVSYTAPIVVEVDGEEQMVLMASTEVVAMNPDDGTVLWRFPHQNTNKNNCSTPLWGADQRLVIGSHSDGGASALAIRREAAGTTVEEVWHSDEIVFFHSTSLRVDDTVFATSGTWSPTELIAFDVSTGAVLWRENGYDKANLLLADGRTILLTEDGWLHLTRMSRQGLEVVSSFRALEETAWAPPTLADGVLYVRDQRRVKAFDLRARRLR